MVNNIGETETAAVKSGIFFPGRSGHAPAIFSPSNFPLVMLLRREVG